MSQVSFLILLLLAAPAFAQDNFATWCVRCTDLDSLLSEEEKTFCTGFNYALQNVPLVNIACSPASTGSGVSIIMSDLRGDVSAMTVDNGSVTIDSSPDIVGTLGNTFDKQLDTDTLMVAPDVPATLSTSPLSDETLSTPSFGGHVSGEGFGVALPE